MSFRCIWKNCKAPRSDPQRAYMSLVQVDSNVISIGGCDSKGQPFDKHEKYNFITDTWTSLAPLPIKKASPAVAYFDNKLNVFGGVLTSQQPCDRTDIFDYSESRWTEGPRLVDAMNGISIVSHDQCCYLVGGFAIDTQPKAHLLRYDPRSSRFDVLPSMKVARYSCYAHVGAGAGAGRIYAVGGRHGKNALPNLEVFELAANSWRQLDDLPVGAKVFPGMTGTGRFLVVCGGLEDDPSQGFTSAAHIFDKSSEKWLDSLQMLNGRGDFACVSVGEKVIVAGGLGNNGRPQMIAECLDLEKMEWSKVADMCTSQASGSFILVDANFSGGAGDGQSARVWRNSAPDGHLQTHRLLVMGGFGLRGVSKSVQSCAFASSSS